MEAFTNTERADDGSKRTGTAHPSSSKRIPPKMSAMLTPYGITSSLVDGKLQGLVTPPPGRPEISESIPKSRPVSLKLVHGY